MSVRLPLGPDFHLLFESAPARYLVLAPDFTIVAVSDAYLAVTMTRRDQIVGRGLFDVFPDNPDDPTAKGARNLRASLEAVLATRAAHTMGVQKYDIRKPPPDESEFEERFWRPINSPVFGPTGEIAYIIHQVEDVTELVRVAAHPESVPAGFESSPGYLAWEAEAAARRHAESALRRSERRLRSLLEHTTDAVAKFDRHWRYTYINPAGAKLGQSTPEALIGKTVWDAYPGILGTEVEHEFFRCVREKKPVRFEVYLPDLKAWFENRCFPMPEGMIQYCTDVTERRRLEEQLRQAQKMEAVGQLAGGVAHDFNNLLTVINGYSELLLELTPEDDSRWALLKEIHSAGERSAGLTRQLLLFSRKQVAAPRIVDVSERIISTAKLIRRLIGEDVRLETMTRSTGKIRIDPGQLEQVVLNLAVNARDAMPRGGRLTIETTDMELDEEYSRTHASVPPGPYIRLAVTDTGSGMTPDVITRVFEPFFTTKGVGKGTGLGLAVVHGVVTQAGGHVEVYSELGVGTTFKVYLPRTPDAPFATSNTPRPTVPRGTETLLLVEDEIGVRTFAQRVLVSQGYDVVTAANGAEALRLMRDLTGPLHLLVTDVVMPEMSGPQLAEAFAKQFPLSRVLYLSGYTDDAIIRHGILHSEVDFLQKPFTPSSLAAKVRAVLDRE